MSDFGHAITAEQLLTMPRGIWRCELVDGKLRRAPLADHEHGRIAMIVAVRLDAYVRELGLGTVVATGTGFLLRRQPDTVRAPDVAFVSTARQSTAEGFFPGAPDLAVEVISPGDSFMEVEEKVFEWLAAGTQAVVVVNPKKRAVSLYRSADNIRVLSETDTLDLSFVVPGFSLNVGELFAN